MPPLLIPRNIGGLVNYVPVSKGHARHGASVVSDVSDAAASVQPHNNTATKKELTKVVEQKPAQENLIRKLSKLKLKKRKIELVI